MEIWDCFCGIGRWRSRDMLLPHDPAEFLSLMDHFGIRKALVYGNMGAEGGSVRQANAFVCEAASQSDRFLPAFILAPLDPYEPFDLDDLASEMRSAGAKAAWMWPQGGRRGHGLHRWLVGDLLHMCAAHRLPLLLFIEGIDPDSIDRMCGDFPKLRVILTGLSYAADQWVYPLLRRHPRLFLCLGHYYIPARGARAFVERFGDERLVFGSGLPHFSPGGLIAHLNYADLAPNSLENILHANLHRLLSEVSL
mgnify:CR=1 FL=1